jgi:hypothetical protein
MRHFTVSWATTLERQQGIFAASVLERQESTQHSFNAGVSVAHHACLPYRSTLAKLSSHLQRICLACLMRRRMCCCLPYWYICSGLPLFHHFVAMRGGWLSPASQVQHSSFSHASLIQLPSWKQAPCACAHVGCKQQPPTLPALALRPFAAHNALCCVPLHNSRMLNVRARTQVGLA